MRIAIFSDTFPPQVNGVAHVVAQSALTLAGMGHDVRVFTVSQGSSEYLRELSQGKYEIYNLASIPFIGYPNLRLALPFGVSMRALMKGWRPQVIHTHTPFGVGWEAIRMARRFRVPLIGTHHTFYDHYLRHVHLRTRLAKSFSWWYTVNYYNYCDLVLSPSRSLAKEFQANGLRRPIEVLPNPVNTELFDLMVTTDIQKQPKASLGLSGTGLVYMGRLSYEKSLDQVIRTMEIISQLAPQVTLTIIGDGPERRRLERLVRKLGLQDRVRFTGFLTGQSLVAALQENDLFITASKTENMPLSVLEAMSAGLPVAAVAMKGLPEIVQDGINGLLIPPDQPEEMAEKVLAILTNQTLLKKFSKAAREYALQYSQERVAREFEKLYEKIIQVQV